MTRCQTHRGLQGYCTTLTFIDRLTNSCLCALSGEAKDSAGEGAGSHALSPFPSSLHGNSISDKPLETSFPWFENPLLWLLWHPWPPKVPVISFSSQRQIQSIKQSELVREESCWGQLLLPGLLLSGLLVQWRKVCGCWEELPVCLSPRAVVSYKMLLFCVNITRFCKSCLETPLFLLKWNSTEVNLMGSSSGALPDGQQEGCQWPGRTTSFCCRKVAALGLRHPYGHTRGEPCDSSCAWVQPMLSSFVVSAGHQPLQRANTDHLLHLFPSALFTELLLRNHRWDKEV